ncbi:MAG: hypothetical protein WAW36_14505 [Methylovulum miyakonense]|uniref:hypothetical protein n=1 Tax=Methylovulum miyakonense TaxID=645578 RepID=UPI003BB50CB8
MITNALSPEATKEILGDNLSFLVAFSSTGEPVVFTPSGTKAEEKAFPMHHPETDILSINSLTAVRTAAKCYVYINGVIYCVPC